MAQYNPPADPAEDVFINLRDSAAALVGGLNSVSWSKIKVQKACTASWFVENYAVPMERTVYAADDAQSIPGTIVQKVWEVMINERVYKREMFGGPTGLQFLGAWMGAQARALYKTIVFPYSAQFTMSRDQARKYFYKNSQLGQMRLRQAYAEWNLDPAFTGGMQPKFTDPFTWVEKNGDLEKWFLKLDDMFFRMLQEFAGFQVDMDKMYSEFFVRAKQGKLDIGGGIDFVYNVHHADPKAALFTDLSQLKPGYVLLDGKFQVGDYTDPGQLFLYALLIYARYRVIPTHTGFIDWTKAKITWFPFSLAQLNQMQASVTQYSTVATRIALSIQRKVETTAPEVKAISIYDVPHLDFRPSDKACRFCGLYDQCQARKRAGIDIKAKAVPAPTRTELGIAFDATTASSTPQDTTL